MTSDIFRSDELLDILNNTSSLLLLNCTFDLAGRINIMMGVGQKL